MTMTYSQWIRVMGWLLDQGYPELERTISDKLRTVEAQRGEEFRLNSQITLQITDDDARQHCLRAQAETRMR